MPMDHYSSQRCSKHHSDLTKTCAKSRGNHLIWKRQWNERITPALYLMQQMCVICKCIGSPVQSGTNFISLKLPWYELFNFFAVTSQEDSSLLKREFEKRSEYCLLLWPAPSAHEPALSYQMVARENGQQILILYLMLLDAYDVIQKSKYNHTATLQTVPMSSIVCVTLKSGSFLPMSPWLLHLLQWNLNRI